jgi:hypothetical protein
MSTQGGGASTEKVCCLCDPFLSGKNVTTCVKVKGENLPTDKTEEPLGPSSGWIYIVHSSLENCMDVGCTVHFRLHVHNLCKVSKKNKKELACTLTSWSASPSTLVSL